jgi:hypothetical protein
VCQFVGLAYDAQMLDGHKYNAYAQGHLNKEKTHQHKEERIELHLECVVPAAWQKYHELLAHVCRNEPQYLPAAAAQTPTLR